MVELVVLVLVMVVPRVESALEILVDAVLWLGSGIGGHGLDLELELSRWQVLGLLRKMSEFAPLACQWVPGPESLGCSVAGVVAQRRWTWVPHYTLREVERSMEI
jgi:hypothetical protein